MARGPLHAQQAQRLLVQVTRRDLFVIELETDDRLTSGPRDQAEMPVDLAVEVVPFGQRLLGRSYRGLRDVDVPHLRVGGGPLRRRQLRQRLGEFQDARNTLLFGARELDVRELPPMTPVT
jgi:hypothetical protein